MPVPPVRCRACYTAAVGEALVRKDIKSNRVGRATLANGVGTIAYRAVSDGYDCGHCGKAIAAGALFSRRTRRVPAGAFGVTPTTETVCLTCRPLYVEDAGSDDGTIPARVARRDACNGGE